MLVVVNIQNRLALPAYYLMKKEFPNTAFLGNSQKTKLTGDDEEEPQTCGEGGERVKRNADYLIAKRRGSRAHEISNEQS